MPAQKWSVIPPIESEFLILDSKLNATSTLLSNLTSPRDSFVKVIYRMGLADPPLCTFMYSAVPSDLNVVSPETMTHI